MSKGDINEEMVNRELTKIVQAIPYRYHFKIHRMYNLKVPGAWKIEKNRINNDLHLVFVKSGNGYYSLDGKSEQLCSGKIIFVCSGMPHSALPDPDDLPSIIPIRFGIYCNTTGQSVNLFDQPFFFSCFPKPTVYYRKLFEKLFHYYLKKEMEGSAQICSSLLYEIFAELLEWRLGGRETALDERITHIKKSMEENPDHRMTIRQWAERCGLSSKQFTRLFLEHYGMTPKQYQILCLVRQADFLLEETESTVTEISSQLGYPDLYTFSKQYKKLTGHSPGSVRT